LESGRTTGRGREERDRRARERRVEERRVGERERGETDGSGEKEERVREILIHLPPGRATNYALVLLNRSFGTPLSLWVVLMIQPIRRSR